MQNCYTMRPGEEYMFNQDGVDKDLYIHGVTYQNWVGGSYPVYSSYHYGPLFETKYDCLSEEFMVMVMSRQSGINYLPTGENVTYINDVGEPKSGWRYQWLDRRSEERKLWQCSLHFEDDNERLTWEKLHKVRNYLFHEYINGDVSFISRDSRERTLLCMAIQVCREKFANNDHDGSFIFDNGKQRMDFCKWKNTFDAASEFGLENMFYQKDNSIAGGVYGRMVMRGYYSDCNHKIKIHGDQPKLDWNGLGCNYREKENLSRLLQLHPGIFARALCDACNLDVTLYVRSHTDVISQINTQKKNNGFVVTGYKYVFKPDFNL